MLHLRMNNKQHYHIIDAQLLSKKNPSHFLNLIKLFLYVKSFSVTPCLSLNEGRL